MVNSETTPPRLEVELTDNNQVRLTFHCFDAYSAMRFYDQLCAGAAEGPKLRIDVEIRK